MTTRSSQVDDGRELLKEVLQSASYPPQDIEVLEREGGDTELVATLLSTTADPHELDQIVMRLESNPLVENASWKLADNGVKRSCTSASLATNYSPPPRKAFNHPHPAVPAQQQKDAQVIDKRAAAKSLHAADVVRA